MAYVEDLSVFFDPDAPGVAAATFTPSGGSPITVYGELRRPYAAELGGLVEDSAPVFQCVAADVANVAHGAALVVGGVSYTVVEVAPLGDGLVDLKLQVA